MTMYIHCILPGHVWTSSFQGTCFSLCLTLGSPPPHQACVSPPPLLATSPEVIFPISVLLGLLGTPPPENPHLEDLPSQTSPVPSPVPPSPELTHWPQLAFRATVIALLDCSPSPRM